MDKLTIIKNGVKFVKDQLQNDYSGHDWYHIERVVRLSKRIAKQESADCFTVEMAALLHDVSDDKLVGNEDEGLEKVNRWLNDHGVYKETTAHIIEIISTLSFRGGNRKPMRTIEGKVVQDADRLDAIGAIGVARTFAYCGTNSQPIHEPYLKPREQMSYKEYRYGKSTAINHFYEKLLRLKDLMNTDYGKKLAEDRHQFMLQFLDQFFKEWEEKS